VVVNNGVVIAPLPPLPFGMPEAVRVPVEGGTFITPLPPKTARRGAGEGAKELVIAVKAAEITMLEAALANTETRLSLVARSGQPMSAADAEQNIPEQEPPRLAPPPRLPPPVAPRPTATIEVLRGSKRETLRWYDPLPGGAPGKNRQQPVRPAPSGWMVDPVSEPPAAGKAQSE